MLKKNKLADKPKPKPRELDARPDVTLLTNRFQGLVGVAAVGIMILVTIAVLTVFHFGRSFILPIFVALLLNFLLSPLVSWLKKVGVPSGMGAALVVIVSLFLIGAGVQRVAGTAAVWIDTAPQKLRQVEVKLRGLRSSIEKVEEATEKIEELANGKDDSQAQRVQSDGPGFADDLISRTGALVFGMAVAVFVLYFLLAQGDLFLRKLVRVLPTFEQKRRAVDIVRRTESKLSTYILSVVMINIGLGTVVGTSFWLLGMPNPVLFGVIVGLLNFVPYLGGLVGIILISAVALISYETLGEAIWPPLVYLIFNSIEANVVTPSILGHRLRLNPVAIFIAVLFWSWIWGVAGAIMAVPLLVALKIVCDNVPVLSAIGEFLGR